MAEPVTVNTGTGIAVAVDDCGATGVAQQLDATRVRQLIALWRKQEEDVEIEAEDEYLLLMG